MENYGPAARSGGTADSSQRRLEPREGDSKRGSGNWTDLEQPANNLGCRSGPAAAAATAA